MACTLSMQTIGPDEFWNEIVWPLLFHLATRHTTLDKNRLAKALAVKPTQADDWLKRAVAEGKLKKQTRPVRYLLPDEGQISLIDEA
jgi:hypothetical protein